MSKHLKILKFFNVIISPWYTIKVDKWLVNVEQLSYTQIHVHFSVIWNSEVSMAQLLSSILCSYERRCLQIENAYNTVNKLDTKWTYRKSAVQWKLNNLFIKRQKEHTFKC